MRERLAEFYGRSPDPDEVAEEMERNKGYGKEPMEPHTNSKNLSEGSEEDVSRERVKRQ